MLCTSNINPFSLGDYFGTSFIVRNLMINRASSVEWTWLELEWHPA